MRQVRVTVFSLPVQLVTQKSIADLGNSFSNQVTVSLRKSAFILFVFDLAYQIRYFRFLSRL